MILCNNVDPSSRLDVYRNQSPVPASQSAQCVAPKESKLILQNRGTKLIAEVGWF